MCMNMQFYEQIELIVDRLIADERTSSSLFFLKERHARAVTLMMATIAIATPQTDKAHEHMRIH